MTDHLRIVPVTLREARAFVEAQHSPGLFPVGAGNGERVSVESD